MYAQRNLRFPCSGCVHLLCVPLLCVSALCACVWCACAALACPLCFPERTTTSCGDRSRSRHHIPRGPWRPHTTTLTPSQSHRIALACPYACACNTVLRASSMHPNVHRITLVYPYVCAYNAVLRAPSMHPNVHVCTCALSWIQASPCLIKLT
jgi:hypothetical protein